MLPVCSLLDADAVALVDQAYESKHVSHCTCHYVMHCTVLDSFIHTSRHDRRPQSWDETLATYRLRWSVAADCNKAVGCLHMLHKLTVKHAKMTDTADDTRSLQTHLHQARVHNLMEVAIQNKLCCQI